MNKRFNGFDGLRAIAIIGIVLYHIMPQNVPGGFVGVNGFFVIMGFFMMYGAKGMSSDFDIKKYYQKKIKRLYPALLSMIALTFILMLIFARDYRKETMGEVLSVVFGYNNFYQIAKNSSYFTRMLNSSPFTHLWYLGLTVQYYLLWPVLLLAGGFIVKKKKEISDRVIIITLSFLSVLSALEMMILYSPKADPSRIYYGTDTRAFSILLGILTAYVLKIFLGKRGPIYTYSQIRMWQKTSLLTVVALFDLAFILKVSLHLEGTDQMTYRGMMQLTTIAFAVFIILIMLDQPRLGKWLDVFPLRIIGKYSYEIYLVMYPVIFLMNQKNRGETSKKIVFETLILIAVFAIVVHFAPIFVLTIAKRIEKRTGEKKFKRAFIAAMISLSFIFSFAQSAYVRANGGVDEVEEMKSLMSENEAMLEAKQNSMITLQASAAKVKNNVNKCVGLLKASVEQKTALNDQALKSAEESKPAEPVVPLPSAPANGVSAIGDSVMLGAAQNMMQTMPGIIIDAKVSRQVKAGIEIVRYLASHSALGSKVIIHLGTNGAPSVEACLELIDAIGPDREIYWVNTHGVNWQNIANANIQEAISQRGNVHLIDWNAYSSGHGEWFYADGIHLNAEGRQAYSNLLKSSIGI